MSASFRSESSLLFQKKKRGDRGLQLGLDQSLSVVIRLSGRTKVVREIFR